MKKKTGSIVLNLILIVLGILTIYPFVWMFSSSFKQNKEIMALEQHLLPQEFITTNYINMNERFDFMRFFGNSLFIAIVITVIVVYTSTICGYVLSKYEFRGRKLLLPQQSARNAQDLAGRSACGIEKQFAQWSGFPDACRGCPFLSGGSSWEHAVCR